MPVYIWITVWKISRCGRKCLLTATSNPYINMGSKLDVPIHISSHIKWDKEISRFISYFCNDGLLEELHYKILFNVDIWLKLLNYRNLIEK